MAARGKDFKNGFGAGDGGGRGCSKGARERGKGGIGSLDLVDVRWVNGSGEGTEGEKVGVRWGDGVFVKALRLAVSKYPISCIGQHVR